MKSILLKDYDTSKVKLQLLGLTQEALCKTPSVEKSIFMGLFSFQEISYVTFVSFLYNFGA